MGFSRLAKMLLELSVPQEIRKAKEESRARAVQAAKEAKLAEALVDNQAKSNNPVFGDPTSASGSAYVEVVYDGYDEEEEDEPDPVAEDGDQASQAAAASINWDNPVFGYQNPASGDESDENESASGDKRDDNKDAEKEEGDDSDPVAADSGNWSEEFVNWDTLNQPQNTSTTTPLPAALPGELGYEEGTPITSQPTASVLMGGLHSMVS